MNLELLSQLEMITPEEQEYLNGKKNVEKDIYTNSKDFVIDNKKMLAQGKLIDIRPHTRFVHFPKHRHNYIEIIYMCKGETTHIINGNTTIHLKVGELLFLNQHAYQEILPASKDDIAVNFIILPEFFDLSFTMLKEESILKDFIIGTLRSTDTVGDYLHYQVSDILPVQNLVENLVWSIVNKQTNNRSINQTTMGLLFLQLLNYTSCLKKNTPFQLDQSYIFDTLNYIEENYKTATLSQLSDILHVPAYQLSKLIKTNTNYNFKELLQKKRLAQAVFLLKTTTLSIQDIIIAVGYENTSYFHRIFKEQYQLTPKQYRSSF